MRKMGWNEGSGIGKNLQGIAAPIEVILSINKVFIYKVDFYPI